ncbi:MAG: diguanylate cyclase, partial [Phycisphaerae bacterium]
EFDEALHRAFHQAKRHGHPLSVMAMDIDLFKAINDMKGHQAGDEVIKVVAGVIKKCCRQSDLPARPGGDEFAVLLPDTSATSAAVVAERIRKTVFERTILIDQSQLSVTASIGIADLNAGRIEKPEDLVALADEALYAAKQLGRNRFVQAHDMEQEDWEAGGEEGDRVELLRSKLAGLDTQFKSLFVRALQEIVQVMERRDPNMADRARKVQHYSTLISRQLNLSEELIKQIELAAMVHDIGMLALPDSVALCSGRLNDEQMEVMRSHTLIGAQILDGTEFLEPAIPVARFHHEQWDGKGYPEGLSGLGIPPICRIVAVADAFDAMTSRRRFREKMSFEEAFAELQKGAGAQFDPDMVSAFITAGRKLGDKLTEVPLPRVSGEEQQDEEVPEPQGEAPSPNEMAPVA